MGGGRYGQKVDILIFKSNSAFYYSKMPDAVIFNYLFNYKIINNKIGFPEGALKKVLDKFDEMKINYIIEYTDGKIIQKNYKKKNAYIQILDEDNKNYDIKKQLEYLENQIMLLPANKLKELIRIIYENIG